MNKLFKYIFYSFLLLAVMIFTVYCIKEHPELQILYFIPGMFILVIGSIMDAFQINQLRFRVR